MAGEINNINNLSVAQANTGAQKASSTAEPETKTRPVIQDTVRVTDEAATLQRLEKNVADAPVVDTQRVEAIRAAIANGTYTVDAEKTATKMIAIENALAEQSK